MNINDESFMQLYEGSGFGNFLKDQSKKFIKKGIEKAVNIGGEKIGEKAGEKVGELIVNKIIPSSKLSEDKNLYTNDEIPIDSGYKIIKLLQKNQPVNNIRKQFNSI